MNKGLTVKDLYSSCLHLIKEGYGDKHICISNDDEGNGYHTLFYGFNYKQKDINMLTDDTYGSMLHDDNDPNEIVLLG